MHYILWMQPDSGYTHCKFNKYFISIDISSIQFQLFFPVYYLLSFITHFVRFTISGGIPEVGPSSSDQ